MKCASGAVLSPASWRAGGRRAACVAVALGLFACTPRAGRGATARSAGEDARAAGTAQDSDDARAARARQAIAEGAALSASIARTAADAAPGARVAGTVIDLSSGARASFHGDERRPMMSVFKLALAVVALDAVDRGALSLAQPVPLEAREVDTEGPIAEAWQRGDLAPTLEVLLTRMLQASDNTAGDKMVTVLGGPAAIEGRLGAMGVPGIGVGEQEIHVSARLLCPGIAPPDGGWTATAVDACPTASEEARAAAARREIAGSPNVATTDAVAELLARLARGEILSAASGHWLLATLAGTTTGGGRIAGLLPPGTPVAHKTGTGGTPGAFVATNDAGIVTLPSGRRFVLAVFVTGSPAPLPDQERAIAKIARAAWDAMP